jgi:hypothetical protein
MEVPALANAAEKSRTDPARNFPENMFMARLVSFEF